MNTYLRSLLIISFTIISIVSFITSILSSYKYAVGLRLTKKSVITGTIYLFISGASGFIALSIYSPTSIPGLILAFLIFSCLITLYYLSGTISIAILDRLSKRREKN